jgi:hypothetical protein
MPKFTGQNSQVRMATTEEGLLTAPIITNVQSVEWDADPSIAADAKGMGFGRTTEVYEGLLYYTGSMERDHDAEPVVPSPGTTTFAQMVEAYQTSTMTKLYIEVTDLDTGEVHTLKKALGKYHITKPIDAKQSETYDFKFEELTHA